MEQNETAAMARDALEEAAFSAAWNAGRTLTWEQAAAYALEDGPARAAP